jgi:ArsR family transcriptional regulator, arsenate/arsenite/antimonite-responsive transcriptional repressor
MAKSVTVRAKKSTAAKISGVDEKTFNSLIHIFKSLADRARLQILLILAKEGEQHVSFICEALQQTQPAVSHHLTQLRNARLVAYRRDGKFNYYKIDSELVMEVIEKFYPQSKSVQQKMSFGEMEITFKAKG